MVYSLADHVRLAREAWERGHALVVSAFAKLAGRHGASIAADHLPPNSGDLLKATYRTLISHLRPLEPYLTDLPLVDDIHPWLCGTIDVNPKSQYGHLSLPWTKDFIESATEETWRRGETDMRLHADEWRQRFDHLEREFVTPQQLAFIEQCILEAIGDKTLSGPQIATAIGYEYNSYLRKTLSSMTKRCLLSKAPQGFGYRQEMSPDNR